MIFTWNISRSEEKDFAKAKYFILLIQKYVYLPFISADCKDPSRRVEK